MRKICRGGYVGFVDSDDYIAPDMYDKMVEKIVKFDADICACNYWFVDEFGMRAAEAKIKGKDKIYTNKAVLKLFGCKTWTAGVSPVCWNKLIKRECVGEIRFPDVKICEDTIPVMRMIKQSQKIVLLNETVYFYVCRPDSLSDGEREDEAVGLLSERFRLTSEQVRFFISEKLYTASLMIMVRNLRRIYKGKRKKDRQKIENITECQMWWLEQIKGINNSVRWHFSTALYKILFLILIFATGHV